MKKQIFRTIMIIAISAIVITSCKKKNDDPTPTPTPTNVLCDGNGTSAYIPLVAGNTWHYSDGTGGNSFDYTITGSSTYISNNYFDFECTLGGVLYLRKITNGNIMAYNNSGAEVLYIPAAPTNGQTWSYDLEYATSRKVVSTSASYNTSSCSYTDCLKIQNLDNSGAVIQTIYYKKGVGMISNDQIWGGVIVTKLTSLTLH